MREEMTLTLSLQRHIRVNICHPKWKIIYRDEIINKNNRSYTQPT